MRFGIDRLLAEPRLRRPLAGRRVALLAHPASVTRELVHAILEEEMARIRQSAGETAYTGGRYETAAKLFAGMMTSDDFAEFMPSLAYELLD